MSGHETKVYNWCTYLKQKEAMVAFDTYQEYPFIEATIRDVFKGDLIGVQRWYDSGLNTYKVSWQRQEFFGMVHYSTDMKNEKPVSINAFSLEYPVIRIQEIVDCLGTPNYYAIDAYLFGYGGFNDSADIVFIYYVERDIEIQVLKPRSQNIHDANVELHFAESYAFPDGQLAPKLDFLAPYPSSESLKVWVQ